MYLIAKEGEAIVEQPNLPTVTSSERGLGQES